MYGVPDLTDVLQVFDVVPLRAHDLVDDVGPHLLLARQTRSQQQAEASLVLLPSLGPLQVGQVLLHRLVLVHTQLRGKQKRKKSEVRITMRYCNPIVHVTSLNI